MNEIYSRAPHRPAASADAHSPHAALLIDFDNVTMGIRSNLGQELRKLLDSDMIRGKSRNPGLTLDAGSVHTAIARLIECQALRPC